MRENETFHCPNCGRQHPVGTTYCPTNGLPIEESKPASRITTWLENLNINRTWIIAGAAVVGGILCLAVFVTLTVLGGRSKSTVTPTLILILPSLVTNTNPSAPPPILVEPTPSPSTSDTPAPDLWQACDNAVYLSRIHVGDTVEVSSDPPLANRVRKDAGLDAEIVGYIEPGERSSVLDGPRCANQWVWWKVRSTDSGMEGWTAEGDADNYWLVPIAP